MKNRVQSGAKTGQTYGLAQTGIILSWVQTKEFKCLAYVDVTGKWINFYTGKPLTDFVKVIG